MKKRILIPTDFSATALNAVRYAMELYKDVPCEFYLLNAFQISGYSVDNPIEPEPGDIAFKAGKDESEQGLSDLLEKLSFHPENPNHDLYTIATYNSLLHAVKMVIAEKDIDLVVMGTKGITGAESLIFGTNAINIMEGITSCPVLAIPEAYGFDAPREIVFPTDFKTHYKRRELNYLLDIASLHKAAIRVLHIKGSKDLKPDQENNKELLKTILGATEHSFDTLLGRSVHRSIGAFVKNRGCNMIAIINRKHTLLDNLLSRPLVKEMGYHYKIPILALNDYR
ncbi:MAG: universal stress protein [Flavobacteriaceae bacterium]